MPKKSRAERLVEQRKNTYMEPVLEQVTDERLREQADPRIEKENRLLWALYRHFDVSQREAIAMTDPAIEVSQSTASRVLRQMDDRILLEEAGFCQVELLDIEPESRLENATEAYLEAYRDVLAEGILRKQALQELRKHEPADWTLDLYPELANEARHVAQSVGLPEEEIPPVRDASAGGSMSTGLSSDD